MGEIQKNINLGPQPRSFKIVDKGIDEAELKTWQKSQLSEMSTKSFAGSIKFVNSSPSERREDVLFGKEESSGTYYTGTRTKLGDMSPWNKE
jgi:hypothetical protein